jgi:hypothetical protein
MFNDIKFESDGVADTSKKMPHTPNVTAGPSFGYLGKW